MSLPTLVPNKALAMRLRTMAVEQDSLSLLHIAAVMNWAAHQYAVDNNAFPETAALDAARCIAASIKNGEYNHNV